MFGSNKHLRLQRARTFQHVLFGVFVFFYTYSLQADILCLWLQETLKATTAPAPIIIAAAVTFLSAILQFITFRIISGSSGGSNIIEFLPSSALILLPTALWPSYSAIATAFCILCLLVTLLYSIWPMRRKTEHHHVRQSELHKDLITRSISLLALFFVIGLLGGSDETLHLEARMVYLCNNGEYEKAAMAGRNFYKPSATILALRAHALCQIDECDMTEQVITGQTQDSTAINTICNINISALPYHLLDFPLPKNANSSMLIYRGLFTLRAKEENEMQHSELKLIGILLDRKIDDFAVELPLHYNLDEEKALPKIYAEALVLYSRLRTNPIISYHNANIEANYRDFVEANKKLKGSDVEQANIMRKTYGDTYWWYYFYNNK